MHLRLRVANVSHDPDLESGSQEIPIWHLGPDRKSPRPIIGGYNDILCGKIQVALRLAV